MVEVSMTGQEKSFQDTLKDAAHKGAEKKKKEFERLQKERPLGDPQIGQDPNWEKENDKWDLRQGATQFFPPKQLRDLDVMDIVTKSLNCGKLNNATRVKIINNVVRELKIFYGD